MVDVADRTDFGITASPPKALSKAKSSEYLMYGHDVVYITRNIQPSVSILCCTLR